MKPIHLAIIGCGGFTFNTLYPMMRTLPVHLTAVCDTDAEKASRFQAFYQVPHSYSDYLEMLEQERPDAVLCVVNAEIHFKAAQACLERGIHVFVEKTPCLFSEQARTLSALSAASGKIMAVGFNRRFATSYRLTKDIINRPEFGSAVMYYSKFNASVYQSNDYFVFNHIIHHIDLARYLLGEITSVNAALRIISEKSGAFIVNFTTENKVIGTIQCASMLEEAYPMERLDIVGTGGNVVVDNLRELKYNRTAPNRDKDFAAPLVNTGDCLLWNLSHGYGIGSGIFSYIGMEAELEGFVNAVQTGCSENCCTIDDCIGTMEIMEKVRQSL